MQWTFNVVFFVVSELSVGVFGCKLRISTLQWNAIYKGFCFLFCEAVVFSFVIDVLVLTLKITAVGSWNPVYVVLPYIMEIIQRKISISQVGGITIKL